MNAIVLAKAGIDDCVDAGMDDCMPGFGTFLLIVAFVIVGGILWITFAFAALFAIARTEMPNRWRLLWAVVVCAIPIVGAVAWYVVQRRGRLA